MTRQFLSRLAASCLLALCLQPVTAAERERGKGGGGGREIIGSHAAAGIGTPRGGGERPQANDRRDRDDRRDWHDSGRRYHDHGGYYADRGRVSTSFGLYLGGPVYADPFWGPRPYYYSPWYYDPPPRTVIIEREPTVYIQRDPPPPAAPAPQAAAPAAPQLWYYCPKPAGYYPYVPQCDQQWVPVDPRNLPPTRPAQ